VANRAPIIVGSRKERTLPLPLSARCPPKIETLMWPVSRPGARSSEAKRSWQTVLPPLGSSRAAVVGPAGIAVNANPP
jgi:hypothetical protein